MATNLALDPDLLDEALRLSGEKTKKAAVTKALQEFVSRRRQKELLQEFENEYKGDETEHNPRTESWLTNVREFFERMTS